MNTPPRKCLYCGSPAECLDHILPVSAFTVGKRKSRNFRGMKRLLAYACLHCNAMLGNKRIETIFERKEFLANRLEEKSRKLLKQPDWTDEELDDLGKDIRRRVEMSILNKRVIQIRIENMRSMELPYDPVVVDEDIEDDGYFGNVVEEF